MVKFDSVRGVAQSLGESGFDRMRFGSQRPEGSYAMGLADVLPTLIRIADKSSIHANDLTDGLIEEIANSCAGARLQVERSEAMEDPILVSFAGQRLTLSTQRPCGLRDLIFSACLFRTYACMGKPETYDLHELISETWLMLADELPQSLTYSNAATLERSLHEQNPEGSQGSQDIHFHAA